MNASQKTIALIVARARNGVIGRDNQLPWHLPNDLKHFKALTMNKPIIMGRNTWESLGKPLPGRDNIVVTRNENYYAHGATVVNDLDTALLLADSLATARDTDEIMIIGGAQIYREALPRVSRAYVTEVDADIDGDACFPPLSSTDWEETAREGFPACEKNPYAYFFTTLDRKQAISE